MQVMQIECAESGRLVSNSMSCGMQVWGAGREVRGRGVAAASDGVVASGRRTCRRV